MFDVLSEAYFWATLILFGVMGLGAWYGSR